MARSQAKKGGQVGLNGEFYTGGQFLPSSERTEKGLLGTQTKTAKKPFMQEVAPFLREVKPEGMQSIFVIVSGKFGKYNHQTKQLDYANNKTAENYFNTKEEIVLKLIALYNSGQKWVEENYKQTL